MAASVGYCCNGMLKVIVEDQIGVVCVFQPRVEGAEGDASSHPHADTVRWTVEVETAWR